MPARSGCGRFARARAIVAVRHCGALQTRANGRATATVTFHSTALRATTSTAARWGLSSAGRCPRRSAAWRADRRSRDCAPTRPPTRRSCPCSRHPSPLIARPGTSPRTHSARRVIAGYPGLVGSVPPAISALTALTYLCVPFARPGSPMRRLRRSRLRVGGSPSARSHAFTMRDQGPFREQFHRPDPREHPGAHPAG